MTDARRWLRRAPRLGAELAVIVAGVLIALSADAWWDRRQERETEIRHLRALHEDLLGSLALLKESNQGRARLFAALERLAAGDLANASPDSVSGWVHVGLFQLENYEPQLTALVDIQASDQLRVLTPEVRRGIAELSRVIREHGRLQDDVIASQQNLLDPYLVERVPLAEILAVADSLPLSMRLPAEPDWSVLETDQLRNAIAFKLSLGKLATNRRIELERQMVLLRGLVEERLNELGRGAS